jgi:hypothetical protein
MNLFTSKEVGVVGGLHAPIWRFERLDWFIAGAAFLLSFIVYALTMTPEICAGDSGELTTAIYNLGAAHPPGYPLYTMLGKVFTYIPLGSVAFRVNLLSVFFGALTIPFLYLLIMRLMHRGAESGLALRDRIISFGATMAFAFSSTMWSQAVIAEVYTLNAVFAPMILLAVLIWQEEVIASVARGRPTLGERFFLLIALLIGMSFTNHLLLVGYVPPLIFFFMIVTQFIHEGAANTSSYSVPTNLVVLGSAASLGFGLTIALFADGMSGILAALLLVVFSGVPAGIAFFSWLSSMKSVAGNKSSYNAVKTVLLVVLGITALISALLFYNNAWQTNLLDENNAARTLVSVLLPLIVLGIASIVLLSLNPAVQGLQSRGRHHASVWAGVVWTFLFLLVVAEKVVMSILGLVGFFLPGAWFENTRIRESLDFIGVGWGFDMFVLLVWLLGLIIIVYSWLQSRRTCTADEQFTATTTLVFKGALFFLLPILLYMTLLIRANAISKIPDPPLSWGETTNASRVINHFLRKQYPKASMIYSNRLPEIGNGWLRMHINQFIPLEKSVIVTGLAQTNAKKAETASLRQPASMRESGSWALRDWALALPLFALLVGIGLFGLYRHNPLWFWLLLSLFATFNVLLLTMLSPRDTARDWFFNEVFFIPSHMIVAVWISFGLRGIANWCARMFDKITGTGKSDKKSSEGGVA